MSCTRCGVEDRPDRLRLSLVNLEREARQDGRPYDGPAYDHAVRCRDRAACAERVRRSKEAL